MDAATLWRNAARQVQEAPAARNAFDLLRRLCPAVRERGSYVSRGMSFRSIVLGAATSAAVICMFGVSAAVAETQTFTTPGATPFTVPAGVTSITVSAVGASGGGQDPWEDSLCPAGLGATVTATVPVTGGQVLAVTVASPGGRASRSTGQATNRGRSAAN
jgi:hypothetical protein